MLFRSIFAENRKKVIAKEQKLFERALKKTKSHIYLNLGCGNRPLEGFVNIDKYVKAFGIENYDVYKLPYNDGDVDAIFCAHVLEHLPIRHAKLAIREWGRVLKPCGKLYLGIPDLEVILHKLLDPTLSESQRQWMMYVLFGFQTDPANRGDDLDYPVDHGQFHTCGFTEETIKKELIAVGLHCFEILKYDGWGTPSIWVVAEK